MSTIIDIDVLNHLTSEKHGKSLTRNISLKSKRKYIVGLLGEWVVINLLEATLYKIIAHRYKCNYGEIDIIAEKSSCLVCIEVKTTIRSSEVPKITTQKKSVINSAKNFILEHPKYENYDIRFDFFFLSDSNNSFHIENAWEEVDIWG